MECATLVSIYSCMECSQWAYPRVGPGWAWVSWSLTQLHIMGSVCTSYMSRWPVPIQHADDLYWLQTTRNKRWKIATLIERKNSSSIWWLSSKPLCSKSSWCLHVLTLYTHKTNEYGHKLISMVVADEFWHIETFHCFSDFYWKYIWLGWDSWAV